MVRFRRTETVRQHSISSPCICIPVHMFFESETLQQFVAWLSACLTVTGNSRDRPSYSALLVRYFIVPTCLTLPWLHSDSAAGLSIPPATSN